MDAYPDLLWLDMVLPTFLYTSDEKLIFKELTVNQKVRARTLQINFRDAKTEFWQSPDSLKLLHFTKPAFTKPTIKKKTKQTKHRKYSVNTLAPYPGSGCINDDRVMVPDTSKLEDHAVEHDLPGGGNATTHAAGVHQWVQDFIQWIAEDKYRPSNFIFIKYYYSVLYSDEGW